MEAFSDRSFEKLSSLNNFQIIPDVISTVCFTIPIDGKIFNISHR